MEIHRFEKVWTAVSILLIVGFVATIVYGAVGPGVAMVSDDGGTVDQTRVAAADGGEIGWDQVENFEAPTQRAQQVSGDRYEIHILAKRFAFEPGTGQPIEVPADSRVTMYITSPDVMHGFELVGTNVNLMIIPGQVSKVTVEFDEPGTYDIVCAEYCGAAHHLMEGQLRVVPRAEWNSEG